MLEVFSPSSPLLTPALSQQKPTVLRITLQIKVEVPGRALKIIGCETQLDLAALPLFIWPPALPIGERVFSRSFFLFLFFFNLNIWTFVKTVLAL